MIWIASSDKDIDNATLGKRLCRLNRAVHGLEGDIRQSTVTTTIRTMLATLSYRMGEGLGVGWPLRLRTRQAAVPQLGLSNL
jgi:hypothetical protein